MTVYRLVDTGALASHNIGKSIRVSAEALRAYLNSPS